MLQVVSLRTELAEGRWVLSSPGEGRGREQEWKPSTPQLSETPLVSVSDGAGQLAGP